MQAIINANDLTAANIKLAITIIKKWLVDTGAIAGERASGFKANWSAAETEDRIISWWRYTRGGNEMADRYPSRAGYMTYVAYQYRVLIMCLRDFHNPETGSLQDRLQTAFWEDVLKYRQELKAYEEKDRADMALKSKARPELIADEQSIMSMYKQLNQLKQQLNDAVTKHNQKCIDTHNREYRILSRL